MSVIIRKGEERDLSVALALIKELAHFEKAPDEVEVSLTEMKEWGFGKSALFEFIVLEKAGKIVGLALYYYKYSTWKGKCLFLEDIIVTSAERRKGYGKLLFNEILMLAKLQKVRRMEWQVLNWNKEALNFYKTYNSLLDDEWINCKLNFDQIQSFDK